MKLISLGQDLATSTEVCALFEPLRMAPFCVSVGIFLLNQICQRLGKKTGDGSPPLHSNQLDF
jgi:hypothetical protein